MAPFCLFSHCNRFGFGGFPSFNLGFNMGLGFTNLLFGGRSFFNFPPAFGMFSSGFMSSPPPLILPPNISSIFEVPKFENNHIDYSAPWMQPTTFKPMMDTLSFGGSAQFFSNPPIINNPVVTNQNSGNNTGSNTPVYTASSAGSKVDYYNTTKTNAEAAAKKDENLECLKDLQIYPSMPPLQRTYGVTISSASFINDIPYAKKGTMEILKKAAQEIKEDLVITSALGTSTSPHSLNKDGGVEGTHYDPNNPKIDLGGGLTSQLQSNTLAEKLMATGYFDFVEPECDGVTWHLDLRIKDSAYEELA